MKSIKKFLTTSFCIWMTELFVAKTAKKFIFKDTNVWQKHYELLELYKKLILVDLDYALEKKAEVDLWNVGFKEIVTQIQSEANSRSILDKSKNNGYYIKNY